MRFIRISDKNCGFTNQIFTLITGILIAINNGDKVVIVDDFLDDYSKNSHTPISQIFNIEKINCYLQSEYNITIVDRHSINFEINTVHGKMDETIIDLTEYCKHKYSTNNLLNIGADDISCNSMQRIVLNYSINGYDIDDVYNVPLQKDIRIDFYNSEYLNTFGWIDKINITRFENILMNIYYDRLFVEKSCILFNDIDITSKINIIHLRIEDDAVRHWSRMNRMTEVNFKNYLQNKYIGLIKKYINVDDETIILSDSLSNGVVDFVKTNNYKYKFSEKYFPHREHNAITDLLISTKCNNTLVGNFNFERSRGSTFSYYIAKTNNNCTQILIDLDSITDVERVLLRV